MRESEIPVISTIMSRLENISWNQFIDVKFTEFSLIIGLSYFEKIYRVSKIKISEFKLLLLRNCGLETQSW